ncbi:TIGR03885 family FMN-dependent LLM class oxidoreductase [Allorhizocola rhizosphaerae]|uniref:TIGR03885 family FMN-dependent LLM class oxidoreductase n=1 Tax=Allorhizocola rhizosphaerae TaxID=1872709 RepID=UPI00319E6407
MIGYHASHEQSGPRELLECVRLAQRAGFGAAMCSDHLFPWLSTHRDGVAFAYAWLGAALEATTLPFGVVSAPGQRYHPVVLAQAASTLEQMYPGRFWLAVGSGEALNEHVTGDSWPDKPAREARLHECVDVMRRLWRGETVDHAGLVRVRRARVYSSGVDTAVPLFAAAVTPETAQWAAGWADGLVTINGPVERMRRVVEAFRASGGRDKPVRLQYHLSWALSREQARAQAWDQWRHAGLRYPMSWDLAMPEDFDAACVSVEVDDLVDAVAMESDLDWHAARLQEAAELGFDQILLHNVGRNQREFIEVFGESVLPRLVGGTVRVE